MRRTPLPLATLTAEQLGGAGARTLRHYNTEARSFRQGTLDHDVSENVAALLRHLPESAEHMILDFGCGPGRDLLTFRGLGHLPVGLDGAERFDGIFANATLFHVPSQELPRVLRQLWLCLKPGGVLFSSNPHGPNREGWSGDRYCCYLDLPTYRRFMIDAQFVELEHYYRPTGKPRHLQPWLASVWRKPAEQPE